MKYPIFFSFLLWSTFTYAQSVYAEILGNGIYYSLNYEHRLPQQTQWGGRVGIGYVPIPDDAYLISPVQILYKTRGRHAL